jgi:L-fucose dehydrogenase
MGALLRDRVAIVTGGAMGIGEGCVRALSEEGASVVIADVDDARGQDLAGTVRDDGGDALFRHADVTSEEDVRSCVQATIEGYGHIAILVNNAGVHFPHTIDNLDTEAWDRLININLKSVFLFCKAALPHIRKERGAIVNISSIRGLTGQAKAVAYCASKSGILGLTMGLAKDEASNGVRVNAVCPSNVLTPLMERWLSQLDDPGAMRTACEQEQALGRMADIMEVGRVVAFLAGPHASFLTGLSLPVEGGSLLG